MLLSITDLALSSLWLSLSLSNKMFFLYFCGVSIYTLSVCMYPLFHLHSLKKQPANENANSAWPSLGDLTKRLENLRQLHLLTLYLFGFCIVLNIPDAFVTLGLSKSSGFGQYYHTLKFLFYFDAGVFLGFLLLHSLQWVAAARVGYFVRQRD